MTPEEKTRAHIVRSLTISLSTRGERHLRIFANVDRRGRPQRGRPTDQYAAKELAGVLKYAFSAYARFEDDTPYPPNSICPALIDALKSVPMEPRVAALSRDREVARNAVEDIAACIYESLLKRNRFVRLTGNAAIVGWNWDKVFEVEYGAKSK